MSTISATFDGSVFRPDEPVDLPPNTTVQLTIETNPPNGDQPLIRFAPKASEGEPYGFLKVLQEANLDGPSDWSQNLHQYLYGEGSRGD